MAAVLANVVLLIAGFLATNVNTPKASLFAFSLGPVIFGLLANMGASYLACELNALNTHPRLDPASYERCRSLEILCRPL